MNPDKHCVVLADEIKAIFQNGLNIGIDVLRYINSTFSNPTLTELETLLEDESDCEQEPLLELIFFPDEASQIRLEPILEKETFSKQDEEKISLLLDSAHIRVPLLFPDGNTLSINLPKDAASRFISRLNISYKTDGQILEAVNAHVEKNLQWTVKVRLRNARLDLGDNKLNFLCMFFEKMNIRADELSECLDFVLNFLTEIKDSDDICAALERRKEFHFLAIQKAAEFEEQFAKNSIETLMVQGLRMPHIDRAKLMREIVIIDRISYLMYQTA